MQPMKKMVPIDVRGGFEEFLSASGLSEHEARKALRLQKVEFSAYRRGERHPRTKNWNKIVKYAELALAKLAKSGAGK